jgi:HD-GYP domain-containing protein (c-di-GMP phosphodiesterase class II)
MSSPEQRLQILDSNLKVLKRPVEKQDTQYVPIPLAVLMVGERVTFDLYLKVLEEGSYHIKFISYLKEGEILESHWLDKLEKLGIDRLFFHSQDMEKAIAYLNNHLLLESGNQAGSLKQLGILREHLNFSLHAAFNVPHMGPHVGLAKKSLSSFFGVLQRDRLTYDLLLEVMYQDYTLYNHSVNVAVLAMAMGAYLEKGEKECLVLGLAGLFHDLGLTKISEEITTKKEALTPEEWDILKKHPFLSHQLLQGNVDIPAASLRLILEHHENAEGSGYPLGLDLKQQHPMTRIMALLEAYDGLTIYRPYRPRHTPFAALKILQEERGRQGGRAFERGSLKKFIEFLALT